MASVMAQIVNPGRRDGVAVRSGVADQPENHRCGIVGQRLDEPVVERLAAFLAEPGADKRTPEDAVGTGESFAEAVQLADEVSTGLQHGGQRFADRRSSGTDDR